jgi:hypothetical protein
LRAAADLLESPDGVEYLAERGVFASAAAFAERLAPPERDDLAMLLGLDPAAPLVYIGHQVCADLASPTVAKFEAARALAAGGTQLAVLWHDMDSTQSERFGARIVLPGARRTRGVWLAPRELEDREPRFIEVERERLEAAVRAIAEWARGICREDRAAARTRVELLARSLLDGEIETLAEANRALLTTLLREQVGFESRAVFASEMVAAGMLVASVEEYVARIDEVVQVFNAAVARLVADDVDPQVRPLRDDYLPLRYSCPRDGTRLRLDRAGTGAGLRAVATCRCGTRYEFELGDPPRLDELRASGRWSIDVSMPVHHNDLASGWVAGRSTALYGIVFNEVLTKVLGRRPLPTLVPARLPSDDGGDETLLVRYLTSGGRRHDLVSG